MKLMTVLIMVLVVLPSVLAEGEIKTIISRDYENLQKSTLDSFDEISEEFFNNAKTYYLEINIQKISLLDYLISMIILFFTMSMLYNFVRLKINEKRNNRYRNYFLIANTTDNNSG